MGLPPNQLLYLQVNEGPETAWFRGGKAGELWGPNNKPAHVGALSWVCWYQSLPAGIQKSCSQGTCLA